MSYWPCDIIPEGKDIWSIIIKNGVLEQKKHRDNYDRVHIKWTGLDHLKNIRLACKPMRDALAKIDLSTNDFFRSTSLRGVINFKKCFPNTKSSFRIRQIKNGDHYGEIYLDHNFGILSISADGAVVYPIDTSEGNQYKYDITTSSIGINVIRSAFFKETLHMIIGNNGLPEGIGGFIHDTCIYSESTDAGIEPFEIFINENLEFDTIKAQSWGRELTYKETIEDVNRRRAREEEPVREESSDESSGD